MWAHLGHDVCFEILKLVSSVQDLLSLSLVSKQTRSIVEPFLYRRFNWTWRPEQPSPPIIGLLNRILQRPALAEHIRSVHFLGDEMCQKPGRRGGVSSISTENLDVAEAIRFIRGSGVSFSEQWEQSIYEGSVDALVVLLLLQLRNLRNLTIGPSFANHTVLFGLMLSAAITHPHGSDLYDFRHLENVSHSIDDWSPRKTNGQNTGDVLPLFFLPTLQCLTISLDNPVSLHWPFANNRYSTVVSLTLTLVREAHLSRILAATPCLKALKWTLFYREDQKHANNTLMIDLSKVGEGLSFVAETLESLIISVLPDEGPSGEIQMEVQGSLRDLKNCVKLRTTDMPMEFLTAGLALEPSTHLVDMVPTCAEAIRLSDDLVTRGYDEDEQDLRLYNAVESALQLLAKEPSSLERITLALRLAAIPWARPYPHEVKELCDRHGVRAVFSQFQEPLGWAWGNEEIA